MTESHDENGNVLVFDVVILHQCSGVGGDKVEGGGRGVGVGTWPSYCCDCACGTEGLK